MRARHALVVSAAAAMAAAAVPAGCVAPPKSAGMLSRCSVTGAALAGTDEATVCELFAKALGDRAGATELVVTIANAHSAQARLADAEIGDELTLDFSLSDAVLAPHHLARFADDVASLWSQHRDR